MRDSGAGASNTKHGRKVSQMKHMNIVVWIVIAAAVLVVAYGVGLLVRHARTDRQSGSPADATALKAMMDKQRPGGQAGRTTDPNLTAKAKAEREKMLEAMKNMTEEQKRRYMEEKVRNEVGAARGRGRFRELPPDERDKITRRWQTMSDEEKKAFQAQTGMSPDAAGSPQNPPEASDTTTQQKPDQNAGQNPEPSPAPGTADQG